MESDTAETREAPGAVLAEHQRVGPVLFFRGHDGVRLHLMALMAVSADDASLEVAAGSDAVEPVLLYQSSGICVHGYSFSLPADEGGTYTVNGDEYFVAGIPDGDVRLAYVACNGLEQGDRERDLDERNVLWKRLAEQHRSVPFHLLLHGGDQLYADEMLDVHASVRSWANGGPDDGEEVAFVSALLRELLLRRYLELYSQRDPAWLLARVPSLCMWDDHDICDGWGSLPARQLDAAIGQAVFRVAREMFMVFQLGSPPDEPPPACPDRTGRNLTWAVTLPGVSLVAPDLRSERRPERVMGETGWRAFQEGLDRANGDRVFVLSSVPALGPRLSWVELAMHITPGAQKYEDDLRDQWQSRWHRHEWRRFLSAMLAVHERDESPVTVLSGEIHLATRATMAAKAGPLHQLVSSGITHPPPPRAYARALGWLARLGEAPLTDHPIRLHPLPGQRTVYTPQRNYLVLQRSSGRWLAWWELEEDGATPPLALDV
ncbi:alkaline phosphatase family protein [Aquisalimonas lutea]|uniref:alkaline phosphatase family protein n=1 Tax=Aquisalimonas lutea TaxID=1327750 RepID=UPI0025B369A3|nr:alkaline phosphatase family protein [Aquisalimonas lutea]MDN3518519.1 alkaline phosphatase family protein [Aquisalimonas lutea]